MRQLFDIVIVGAGPAGLAAAYAATDKNALRVAIVDDNPLAGGQIWRGGPAKQQDQRARQLWQALEVESNVTFLPGTRVLMQTQPGELLVQDAGQARTLRYNRLILATGGTGDILTGMVAGMMAQHPSDIFEAVITAVYLQGLAGDIARESMGEYSLVATDLLKALPQAFNQVRDEARQGLVRIT